MDPYFLGRNFTCFKHDDSDWDGVDHLWLEPNLQGQGSACDKRYLWIHSPSPIPRISVNQSRYACLVACYNYAYNVALPIPLVSPTRQKRREKNEGDVRRRVSKIQEYGSNVHTVIESMAENLIDFKLSPMLSYAFLGVSGAVAFRAINTLDGMVGFKDSEHIQRAHKWSLIHFWLDFANGVVFSL